MQMKVVVTILAFLLLTIVLASFAWQEPDRLHIEDKLSAAKQVEAGAQVYQAHCQVCHGEFARSEVCRDDQGGQIACQGRALNNYELLCEVNGKSARMRVLGWEGTKQAFIEGTITTGRPWNDMPAWGKEYGGPLDSHQIREVTAYILNFTHSETSSGRLFPFSPIPEWPIVISDITDGDAERGAELYSITYGCASCHGDPKVKGSNQVGSWSGIFKNTTLRRGEVVYSAADYFYESVLYPNRFIARECPQAPQGTCFGPSTSSMPDNFGLRMGDNFQDMADIMAYLGIDPAESNQVEIKYPPMIDAPSSRGYDLCSY